MLTTFRLLTIAFCALSDDNIPFNMKILSAQQIREADQYTITHEPISSINLMERASASFKEAFTKIYSAELPVVFICGPGNNGGDGLAIARMLYWEKYNIRVVVPTNSKKGTEDFKNNLQRLPSGIIVHHFEDLINDPQILKNVVVVDALIGSGLSRKLDGEYAELVRIINQSGCKVVSVDIPSGLFPDTVSPDTQSIVRANHTLTFQMPRLSFLLPDYFQYCGDWKILDIGLHDDFISQASTPYEYLSHQQVAPLLKPRYKFNHKGDFGKALIMGGSVGKMGAAILSARACLRAGIGLLSVQVPACGYQIIQTAVPEAMVVNETSDGYLCTIPDLALFDAIGIGPGLGQHPETVALVSNLLENSTKPLVLDADALNILSIHSELIQILPAKSILTPHFKEFERLTGFKGNGFDRIKTLQDFAFRNKVIVVLKGAHTAIATPEGSVYFNSTGNPGMATGGSGDVLTGIITALLAQHYTPENAAILGVYLHGLAGDLAARKHGVYGLIPSDIVEALPKAFTELANI